jgi:hypothetical protein
VAVRGKTARKKGLSEISPLRSTQHGEKERKKRVDGGRETEGGGALRDGGGGGEWDNPRDQPFCAVPDTEPRVCFMQLNPSSSFTGGKALRATATVLPTGHDKPISISVGVDALSDATFAVREILSDVHSTEPDIIRGSSGSSL